MGALRAGKSCEEGGSGVGLAAMVGCVALAGAALAGAFAHVYSKSWDRQWPVRLRYANFRPVRGRSPLFLHSWQSGDYLGQGDNRTKAINTKSF